MREEEIEILIRIIDEIQDLKNNQCPDNESVQENSLYYKEFREEIRKLTSNQ